MYDVLIYNVIIVCSYVAVEDVVICIGDFVTKGNGEGDIHFIVKAASRALYVTKASCVDIRAVLCHVGRSLISDLRDIIACDVTRSVWFSCADITSGGLHASLLSRI